MSYVKHFSQPFSKEKSYAIVEKLSHCIADHYNLGAADSNPWPEGSGPNLYSLSYEKESEISAIGKRQFNALFEKNLGLDIVAPQEREVAAFTKWVSAEEQCRKTNARFNFEVSRHSPERNTLIFLVQRKIASILGPCPSLSALNFGFGPGANVGCTRLTSARRKLAAQPTISTKSVPYVSALQTILPHWPLQNYKVAKGKLTFVAKNATIDRAIVIEPIVNTFVQKGIGDYIREQLKKVGVNLRSQETNRDFARLGSLTNLVSTIDLSSASDTVAKSVVSLLLPYDWESLLDGFRTPTVSYKGTDYTLQKWSSMGNGYTFELESLIFFAIASVISNNSRFVNVYGDDIIVPSRHTDRVVDALEYFGFTVNMQKSFYTGRFRESCGKDFLDGVDIRPCYVKKRLSYQELFRLHNFFIRRNEDDIARFIMRFIPITLRRYTGPDGYGDGHLIGGWNRKRSNRQIGWGGYSFKTIVAVPYIRREQLRMDYAAFLYQSTRTGITSNPVYADRVDTENPLDMNDPPCASESMYTERSSVPRWRTVSVYTLGPLD